MEKESNKVHPEQVVWPIPQCMPSCHSTPQGELEASVNCNTEGVLVPVLNEFDENIPKGLIGKDFASLDSFTARYREDFHHFKNVDHEGSDKASRLYNSNFGAEHSRTLQRIQRDMELQQLTISSPSPPTIAIPMEKESNELFEPTITSNEERFVNDIYNGEFSVSFISKIGDIFKYFEPNAGGKAHILDRSDFGVEDSYEHGPNLQRIQDEMELQVKDTTAIDIENKLRPQDGNIGPSVQTTPMQVVKETPLPSSLPRNDVIQPTVYLQDIHEETITGAKYYRKLNQEASGGSNNKMIFENVNTQDECEYESIPCTEIQRGTPNIPNAENSLFRTRQTFQNYNSIDKRCFFQLLMNDPGEKPYVCETCNKSFRQKINLKRHSNIHTDERPYTCSICDQSFRLNSTLWTHLKLHKDEKPHVCGICEKSFRRKGELLQHSRVHTGEKPFVCDVCQKGFSQIAALRRHSELHTD